MLVQPSALSPQPSLAVVCPNPYRLMTMRRFIAFLAVALSAGAPAQSPPSIASLPQARANVAVAAGGSPWQLVAMYGLGAGTDHAATASDGWRWDSRSGRWRSLPAPAQIGSGRLAASALWLDDRFWLIGGYTVAADGSERSTPEVYSLDTGSDRWLLHTQMRTPVDDSVALAFADRWMLLISGWYDTGNVDLVQIYDTRLNRWSVSSQWPGPAVFGHAGGIVDDQLVVCDGVAVVGVVDGKRQFALRKGCWHGQIVVEGEPEADSSSVAAITWTALPEHPCPGTYRAAAVGTRRLGARVLFAGGGTRAYNFDGIGYDGDPVQPSACVFSYDLTQRRWQRHADLDEARMDLRGLIETEDGFALVGGLSAPKQPTGEILRFRLAQGD